MKIKFDEYRIGLLTKHFGLTPDTIRLYEKKGILKSVKNDENHYRVFLRDDIFNMTYVMRLRKMHFPLSDIYHILCDDGFDDTLNRISQREAEIQQEIEQLNRSLKQLQGYKCTLGEAMTETGKVSLTEPLVLLSMDIGDSLVEAKNTLNALDPALAPKMTCLLNEAISYPINSAFVGQKEYRYKVDFLVTAEDIHLISERQDFLHSPVTALPKRRYLRTVIGVDTGVNYEELSCMERYLTNHPELTPVLNENYYRFLMTQHTYENSRDYYEWLIPVQN